MEALYERLGFKRPEYLENPYGIKIYIGTKGEDDWGVVIPKELVKMKCKEYNFCNDYNVYFVDETYALTIAEMYTELAERLKG